jgi:hypothetical protein
MRRARSSHRFPAAGDDTLATKNGEICKLAIAAALLLLSACGGEQSSPKDAIKAVIEGLEQAVETGSLQEAEAFLHPQYKDRRHPSKRAALGSLWAYRQRHRTIHLFSVIKAVDVLPAERRAKAVVYVAMTGTPVDSVATLVAVRADLYRFDIEFIGEGDDWRILNSAWRRADLSMLQGTSG